MRWLGRLCLLLAALWIAAQPAMAVEAVKVAPEDSAIDLSGGIEMYVRYGDRIQVSTAPGSDGIVRRIEVRTREPGRTASWAVFALQNDSDEQIDRLIVAPHFRLVGSGVLRPDLGASRIAAITPSQGFRPERQDSQDADVFLVTLDPGTVVTFVAELRSDRLPQLRLWEPNAYKDKTNSFTLYQGIVLGISGLLALFLTVLFVVRGTLMFPAAAAVAWAVLAYLCIDFGFWHKLVNVGVEDDQIYRAGAEAIFAATLLMFLFSYLSLNRWHVRFLPVAGVWFISLLGLVWVAIADAPLAAGIARISIAAIVVVGLGLILFLTFRGFDRAFLLIPTWLLLLAWLAGAWMIVSGRLGNDLVSPALNGGLVILVLLIGFTVMQHAFSGAISHGVIPDVNRKALALIGAGYTVWDWEVQRDRLSVGAELEPKLGLSRGSLEGQVMNWIDALHAGDRDRFRTTLDTLVEQRRGRIAQDFRLRADDGHYLWMRMRARPILGTDGEVSRVVGTLVDVTDARTSEERILHDAVHDNLTGLPGRELFLDRLDNAMMRTRTEGAQRPTVMVVDLDRFRQVNDSAGIAIGDSMLLTVARRLQRLLKPQDTLARLAGDQFGIIVISETEAQRITGFAESVRKTVRTPIAFGGREIILTACLGLAIYDGKQRRKDEILEDAEIAMYYAKRNGPDRIEAYRPLMRSVGGDRLTLESDLRRAIERGEIHLLYQPIINLENGLVAGFEALVRWDHPRFGRLNPAEFISIAEETGLIVDIGLYVLETAARQLGSWQRSMGEGRDSLFMSVNISSRQLLRHDFINDVKAVLGRSEVKKGTLKLEITESLVMENPEYCAQVLTRIRELGAGLALDDFGTGYSALGYLHRFPFDVIKVDKTFVQEGANGHGPVVLQAIVTLAHDLGMEVVAEGAETEHDRYRLEQLDCEYAQGFLFGAPMHVDEARKLLQHEGKARHA
ncbi:MAG: EAL domain-containing protein [Rhodobiaceae bacterium]|nr:EAL domain-containing protein [Rhodobiaceae bacterium]MCC0054837.1 EAL domain-containing protein [Rhodobiaceae bacterium]